MTGEIINLREFTYHLPEERIAKFPLPNRSDSKLLRYHRGEIAHDVFKNIDQYIHGDSTLFFNNTRVIPARLHFYKETGAHIEIFLLDPLKPTRDIASAMLVKNECFWHCMVGNLKKWKSDQTLQLDLKGTVLGVSIADRDNQTIRFSWDGPMTFVDVIQQAGKIPLPPYIKREVEVRDKERYQTVYSKEKGAVAAPTAGLHFDEGVIEKLKAKGVKLDYLTLHVSAGTFQPIKAENIMEHPMHHEQIVVSRANIENLLKAKQAVAVGTTSMRTLESLYWFGVDLMKAGKTDFKIDKLRPYQGDEVLPGRSEVCHAILDHMEKHQLDQLGGITEIFIFPGFKFHMVDGLITNYHLPGSTLILLVAAFIGDDWKKVYQEALDNEYRFLSYGDSSLLIP